jgi:hypothetical protein
MLFLDDVLLTLNQLVLLMLIMLLLLAGLVKVEVLDVKKGKWW